MYDSRRRRQCYQRTSLSTETCNRPRIIFYCPSGSSNRRSNMQASFIVSQLSASTRRTPIAGSQSHRKRDFLLNKKGSRSAPSCQPAALIPYVRQLRKMIDWWSNETKKENEKQIHNESFGVYGVCYKNNRCKKSFSSIRFFPIKRQISFS